MKKGISRRDFIKGTAAGAVSMAAMGLLGACSSDAGETSGSVSSAATTAGTTESGTTAAAADVPVVKDDAAYVNSVEWDAEYDVVIIGFGGAGASAAITAADAGAKVLLVETAKKGHEGGNTKVCYQILWAPNDREGAIEYYKTLRGSYTNSMTDEIIELIVDESMKHHDWLVGLGMDSESLVVWPYSEYADFPGAEASQAYIYNGEIATSRFWQFLYQNVKDRSDSIDIWYNTRAARLLQDKESKVVHGVAVENGSTAYNVRAIGGVIMACGGFENNIEMIQSFVQMPEAYSKGAHYNNGDGIKMAIDVGAELWHMSTLSGPDPNFIYPESNIAAGYAIQYASAVGSVSGFGRYNMIMVGGDATRFTNESKSTNHGHVFYHGSYKQLQIPENSWCLFDETARLSGKVYSSWSEGSETEIEKGYILKAESVEELAEVTGLDEEALKNTITQYNSYCANGEDPDWARSAEYLLPLDTPPYYALPLKPSFTNTQGGARRNTSCEILDVWGEAIPHLYGAGEFGSFYPDIYQGGGNLSECMFTGRISATNALTKRDDTVSESLLGNKQPVNLAEDGDEDITLADNEYIGVGTGMGGDVKVKVTMDGDTIVKVEVIEHSETVGTADGALEQIPQAIVEAGSADVDVVAGATLTSKAIMEAVQNALDSR